MIEQLTHLKSALTFWRRRSAAQGDAPPADAEPGEESRVPPPVASDDAGQTPDAAPRPTLLARIQALLRRRRQDEGPAEEDAETVIMEHVAVPAAGQADADGETAEAPAPARLQRFLSALRHKRIWIPLTAAVGLTLVGGVAYLLVAGAQEQARLKQELAAARAQLAQPAPAAVSPTATPAPPNAAEANAVLQTEAAPAKRIDPAFEIVGHTPVGEQAAGVDAADCVVRDREQVAQNLKRCIESFNAAMAEAAPRRGKP